MNEYLQEAVSELEMHLPQLAMQRASHAFVNDLYEAVCYWCELGRWVLQKNTKVNYPERVRDERELLTKLESILQGKPRDAQLKYGPVLSTGREILRIVGEVEPPKDGHLGFLRIVRKYFQFLETNFGFFVTQEQPASRQLSSGAVYLELEYSHDPWMSCLFGPELGEGSTFQYRTFCSCTATRDAEPCRKN